MASTVPLSETVVNGLGLGLSKEAHSIKDCTCPLLCLERHKCPAAFRAAALGPGSARVVLARARQRLERAR
jgi:hypothetical protein